MTEEEWYDEQDALEQDEWITFCCEAHEVAAKGIAGWTA